MCIYKVLICHACNAYATAQTTPSDPTEQIHCKLGGPGPPSLKSGEASAPHAPLCLCHWSVMPKKCLKRKERTYQSFCFCADKAGSADIAPCIQYSCIMYIHVLQQFCHVPTCIKQKFSCIYFQFSKKVKMTKVTIK